MADTVASRQPTVVDVGALAGVSRQTVSNVLNTPHVVAPATRARVEDAILRLGYRPHASARRLRTRKSSTIGIRLDPVSMGISGAVVDRFLHALTEQADTRDQRIVLYTAADAAEELRQIRRLLEEADVDSVVLTSTAHGDPRVTSLMASGDRFACFGRPWGWSGAGPAPRWVDVDARAGVRAATQGLQQSGARRIAFLGWPEPSGSGGDRRAGWREAMLADGNVPAAELSLLDLQVHDSVDAATKTMGELLSGHDPIDGVVCASDTLALGAALVVPSATPVVGFGDTPIAEAIGFSSVREPLDEVAGAILELLTGDDSGVGDGQEARTAMLMQPFVVWRGSGVKH